MFLWWAFRRYRMGLILVGGCRSYSRPSYRPYFQVPSNQRRLRACSLTNLLHLNDIPYSQHASSRYMLIRHQPAY
ncbi:hypothetical protein BZA05DRAFT_270361 [Tricharina praecox]|uniref:uncharacterized protein n=1 Tax=Tricharina praecox TaxID=43433 RepID=UPI0022207FD4|nr:uncharacterized protein BZA05DRAFT_270361 [Tricharina praecox]KAI5853811.1 hypothetical protein BZA05DRAFT_270361 [Tricharina praecox]